MTERAGSFTETEVHFSDGSDLLAGTLTMPASPGPHAAIAMVSGSGAQDRDYGGAGAVIRRQFARNGIACLSWDKPGVGRSTGDYNQQAFDQRAAEAIAAVHYLQSLPGINPKHAGLWGHSQGGMVAPLAASQSIDVAFLIEVSGWQGPAWQQDPVRVECELRAMHLSESDVSEGVAFARRRMELIRGQGTFEELDAAQEAMAHKPWFVAVHRCDRTLFLSARRLVNDDSTEWWRRVHCPVLAIYGGADLSCGDPARPLSVIRRGMERAGNRDLTVRVFPHADHSICTAGRMPVPSFADGYFEAMSCWLDQRTR